MSDLDILFMLAIVVVMIPVIERLDEWLKKTMDRRRAGK